ncbi:MAG: 50S ribosomal protein L32 [Eubacteriales bacterium]
MAVPKRKTSKARRDKRRSSVWKLDLPAICKCPKCGEFNLTHRVCKKCGYYKGQEIVPVAEKKA